MEGLKVMCRSCGCVDLYETTEAYNPSIRLTGDMLRLQKPYDSFNWEVYEGAMADKSTSRFLMFCTRCGGYITTDGRLAFADPSFDIHRAIAEAEYAKYSPEIPDVEEPEKSFEDVTFQPVFVCPVPGCGKVCASKAGLAAHVRLAHKEK